MHQRYQDLTALADHYRTDKGSVDGDRHRYTELYAACFESFRLKSFTLLELGLLRAPNATEEADPAERHPERIPSIDMWLDYFPRAHIYGFDLADFSTFDRPRFTFIRGDLSNSVHLDLLAHAIPAPRIIIDDASHASFHQQRAFLRLFPLLEPGGFYVIEDLHYSPPFEGELPPCRRMADIVHEFLDTGALRLDFGTGDQQEAIASEIQHTFVHGSDRGRSGFGPKLVIFQKTKGAEQTVDADTWLTPGWLTSRGFAFLGSHPDRVIAQSLRFDPNGRLAGYHSQNEAGWRIQNGCLLILREDGQPSCIATPRHNPDGTVSFSGAFLQNPVVVHRFEEIPRDARRPTVNSFDLFDTLVARRCHDPIAIFRNLESQTKIKDFARIRQSLESRLWHAGDYELDDIYDLIGKETNWEKATLDRLKMMELAEEWDNLFPIASMIAKVGPNDLIVSDMYLPPVFIRRLVDEKCGLRGHPIYLSSHGKSRGEIWPKLLATYDIARHYGDNHRSDVEGALKAGIEAEHVTVSFWTRGEQILRELNLDLFARAIREARLSFYEQNESVQSLIKAQFEFNLPLLLLASIDVLRHAADCHIDTLLMCARDCNLWFPLMQVLAHRSLSNPAVRYVYGSRVLMVSGSPEYRAYIEQMSGRRTLLVDVSGTGRSPSHFIGTSGRVDSTSLYLLAATQGVVARTMDELAPQRTDVETTVLEWLPTPIRLTVESLNMSLEGKNVRMAFTGHGFKSITEPNEFGPASRAMIAAMRRAFLTGVAVIEREALRLPETIARDTLVNAVRTLMLMAPDYHGPTQPIRHDIERAEAALLVTARAERDRYRGVSDETDGIA
jgi:hypothetical protein